MSKRLLTKAPASFTINFAKLSCLKNRTLCLVADVKCWFAQYLTLPCKIAFSRASFFCREIRLHNRLLYAPTKRPKLNYKTLFQNRPLFLTITLFHYFTTELISNQLVPFHFTIYASTLLF